VQPTLNDALTAVDTVWVIVAAVFVFLMQAGFLLLEIGFSRQKNVGTVADQPKPLVYILDRPGAEQSIILAADLAPPKANPHEYAVEAMTSLLGGQFTSRVNMNLREDKHWSYGAFTFVWDARGQRPFIAYAPVQTDKTKESMIEVDKELRGIIGPRPITADELSKAQANLTLSLPGTWETMDAVLGSLEQMVTYGLDDHYFETYADRVRAQTIPDATTAAQEAIRGPLARWQELTGESVDVEPELVEAMLDEARAGRDDADGRDGRDGAGRIEAPPHRARARCAAMAAAIASR
jgi:zinc protease